MLPDDSSDAPTFGDLLRQHRRARDLTQETLAERAAISVRAISDLERGARTYPYRETAKLLANALGLTGAERAAFLTSAHRPLMPASQATQPAGLTRLPSPLTPLIGRSEELAEVTGLLRDEQVRLLTLTGTGGVGKTRLALAAAVELRDAYPDGIVFVDLAPQQEPAQVVSAVAAALGLKDRGSTPLLETMHRFLGPRQMLLVLDNFEHLIEAAPTVSDLLQVAPALQILVTSREIMRLWGEREYPVLPLRLPGADAAISLEELAQWDGIRLFLERALDAQPGFRITAENASHVVAICQQLDGLPLAIELAAARVKILPPEALLPRLERRLPLLTRGRRDALARQRTLRTAIAWSYDLLDPREQALFRSLAVFTGGWTIEAAEAVGDSNGELDVLDELASLTDKSLIHLDGSGSAPRYRMLETVREYAVEQLMATGEEVVGRRAHLGYLLQLVRENDLNRLDAETEVRLARLAAEEANLRAGFEWALVHDPESALELIAGMGYFWHTAGLPAAGFDLLERVLATGAGANRPERARALQQAAWLAIELGYFERAALLTEAALSLAEQVGDTRIATHALLCQASVVMSRGDADLRRTVLEDALLQFESLGDEWGRIVCLNDLGLAALDRGDAATALEFLERCYDIVAEHELSGRYRMVSLSNLAEAYRDLGHHEAAERFCTEALALAQDSGNVPGMAVSLGILGTFALDRGETARAASFVEKSLALIWEFGVRWDLASFLERTAAVLAAADQTECAARLYGSIAALREVIPWPIGASDRTVHERYLADVRSTLGEPAFTRAWTEGRARLLSAAVADAQEAIATIVRSVESV